jgi:hypothetical protein
VNVRNTLTTALCTLLPLTVLLGMAYVPAQGQVPQDPPDPQDPAEVPAGKPSILAPVAAALRNGDAPEAARLLKAMKQSEMSPADRIRWQRFATLVAIRVGDKAWRDQIAKSPSYSGNSQDLLMVSAARLLQDGYDDECQKLLDMVKDPDNLAEIPKRRYYTLRARLAQFNGDKKAERVYITRLVNIAGEWEQPKCQVCHANPRKFEEQITTLDVSRWWVGERFAELVKPDAVAIELEAQQRLAQTPTDTSARLRLAYAQRAQGKAKEAEETLRQIPWAEFPDREKRQPLRFSQFP